jgi:hypothetical protein
MPRISPEAALYGLQNGVRKALLTMDNRLERVIELAKEAEGRKDAHAATHYRGVIASISKDIDALEEATGQYMKIS